MEIERRLGLPASDLPAVDLTGGLQGVDSVGDSQPLPLPGAKLMHCREYPFHDGHLTSIAVADSDAVMGLKQADGSDFVMTLTGVEALNVEGFRLGNTILALRVVSGACPPDGVLSGQEISAAMDALFPAPHLSAAANHHERHAAFMASRLDRLSRGQATLVVLNPVYGAELCAYCLAIDLQGRPPA